jgi:hypothetical protein
MHFQVKNTFKSNRYHNAKQALKLLQILQVL